LPSFGTMRARFHRLGAGLAAGPQPRTSREVGRIARSGFRTIVNLAQEGEPGQELTPNVEATWAHAFGLEHVRVSMDERPSPDDVERFLRALRSAARPVFVHSTGGARAAALAAIAFSMEQGRPPAEVLRQLARDGSPLPARLGELVEEETARRRPDAHSSNDNRAASSAASSPGPSSSRASSATR
jgi:uncharacterized protein (TIGR01244 family)